MANRNGNMAADANLINVNTTLEGNVTTKGNIRIDGKLKGNLTSDGAVMIGATGKVVGDINAKSMVCGGRIEGRVSVLERTILEASSTFSGELKTKKLIVEEGAVFDGQCHMNGKELPGQSDRKEG